MKNEAMAAFKEDEILDIEKVIECYNSYIYTILKNNISNELDIEEILSDVFMIFWQNYKRLSDNTNVKAYLVGITKNLIKKKYRQYYIDVENIELYEDKILSNIDIQELVENDEKSKIISNCLESIKNIDKEIFIMFYYYQKKVKDISKTLGISETKVKVILHRTRKLIRKNLKERGYSYGK